MLDSLAPPPPPPLSRIGKEEADGEGGEEGEKDGRHDVVIGDVRESRFWTGLRGREAVKGKIDILVNAAGLTHYSPFLITSEERMQEVLDTNLMGTVLGCKTVGKGMLKGGGGEFAF